MYLVKKKDEIKYQQIKYQHINIFVDESFPTNDDNFLYIGALFLPTNKQDDIIQILKNSRCISNNKWFDKEKECPSHCSFHKANNTEVHFKKLGKSYRGAMFKIAKQWIGKIPMLIKKQSLHFMILGIDESKLDKNCFHNDGEKKFLEYNIYSRFFRTVLLGGISYFFSPSRKNKIIIDHVYHDKGPQEDHPYFSRSSIRYIEYNREDIHFRNNEVEFIDSDHRKSKSDLSQLIQLIDLILGATRRNFISKHECEEKDKTAQNFQKILRILLDRKTNNNGDYVYGKYYESFYHRKASVSFFPKNKLNREMVFQSLDFRVENTSIEKGKNNFYYQRDFKLLPSNQLTLREFFRWSS